MPARLYGDIADKVHDFFSASDYAHGRKIKVEVSSKDLDWEFSTKLKDDNTFKSTLETKKQFGKDTLSVVTSTADNPSFTYKTKRVAQVDQLSVAVEEPKFKFGAKKQMEKYAVELKTAYNWKNKVCDATASFAFEADKFAAGASVQVARDPSKNDGAIGQKDFGVRAEFRQTETRKFSLRTEEATQLVLVGVESDLPRDFTGFLEVGVWREEQKDGERMTWAAGVEYPIDEQNEVRALYRKDQSGTVQLKSKSAGSFTGTFAWNFDHSKGAADRHRLEYKLAFGI
jgi:hypothetical protein